MIITVPSFTFPADNIADGDYILRFWYLQSFLDSTNQFIASGTGTTGTYFTFDATASSGVVTIDPMTIYSTLDANVPFPQSIQCMCRLYKRNSGLPVYPFNQVGVPATWVVPSSYGATMSFAQWTDYNQASTLAFPAETYPSTDLVARMIAASVDEAALNQDVVIGSYTSFANAVSTIGSTATTLVINQAASVTANTTVPSMLTLKFTRKGSLTLSTGVTLIVLGPIEADPVKIFFNATSGQGTVAFSEVLIQEIYPEWWGAAITASATINTTALQAAMIAAGTGRTNGSGDTIYNRILKFSGIYNINGELSADHTVGFNWQGQTKLSAGINQTAANTKIIDANAIAYGVVSNLKFSTDASQNVALLDLYNDGTGTSDLSPQNITFYDCVFQGNGVGLIGVWIARPGGGSQGDNVRFYNCYGNGFLHSAACLGGNNTAPLNTEPSGYAYNAINVLWEGGDIQSCPNYALASYGGNWIVKDLTCENGNFTYPTGAVQTGADFHFEAPQTAPVLENIRSESLRFLQGSALIRNCSVLGPATTLVAMWPDLPGTRSFQAQLVTGTPYGGDGKVYEVTSTTVFSAFNNIIAPFTSPSFDSGTGLFTLTFNVTGPLVVNVLIGETLVIRYPNCFDVYTSVVSNTATTITVQSLSTIFGPADVSPAQACGLHTTYATVTSIPEFGGLGSTAATGGSLTTIVKAAAAWTVNEWAGQQVTIMSGSGKYQHGAVTSNTADTITVTAWLTDYPTVGGVTPANTVITAPDATTHFVIEPQWNGGTVTSGSVSMDYVDCKALDGDFPGVSTFAGRIEGFNSGFGTYVRVNPGTMPGGSIKDFSTTRQDWFTSNGNILDDTYPVTGVFERIIVRRYGAADGEYLPWSITRNGTGALVTFDEFSQNQRGREAFVWSQGQPGGGVAFTDVWLNRGDGVAYTDGDQVSRNILAYQGMLGRKSPLPTDSTGAAAPNQAGLPTQVQGGLSTGNGTPGALELWLGSVGGSGTSINAGTKKAFFDTTGFNLSTPQIYTPIAFADGATTPSVASGSLFTTANTSPTSISDFFGSVGQLIIIVVGDANTTFVNGATLVTRSGSNISAANGRTYSFVNIAGIWRQVN